MYLQVVLNIPLRKSFEYAYNPTLMDDKPASTLAYTDLSGFRVLVPFGPKKVIGVVVSTSTTPTYHTPAKIKPIIKLVDEVPLFSPHMLKLLSWASDYYHYPIGEVVLSAVPPALRKGEAAELKEIEGFCSTQNPEAKTILKRSPACLKALEIIANGTTASSVLRDRGIARTTINKLLARALIKTIDVRNRTPWDQNPITVSNELTLNQEQQVAFDTITKHQGFGVFLINGVTGSGKTEVYLQLIHHCLKKKQQALILVPEINLTPQTFNRFYNRFNVPVVSIHSAMNNTERLEAFLRIKNNEAAILIGTRSAIFAEIPNLGIIVIDEEHDSSYRQGDGFLYHCRDLAIMRARALNIPVVLGTATPSIESLNNAIHGKYIELKLTQRAADAQVPEINLIDMRHATVNAGLSQELLTATATELKAGNQVLFLLNRRGYAPKMICHDCGHVLTCEHCSSNLFLHASSNVLKCHHCETIYPIPRYCPACGSSRLVATGTGTEKICEYLSQVFPTTGIIRIDRDTTTQKGSINKILADVLVHKYQILVGTQILAKGHHFPDVTLVGILDIDSFLNSNDFRATEYAAQLITQVSGRAGRGAKKGRVLLQTYQPQHKFLQQLLNFGYDGFAKDCLKERAYCELPPFKAMAAIKADSPQATKVASFLNEVYLVIDQKLISDFPEVQYSHPLKPFIDKRINRYHMFLIIIAPNRMILGRFLNLLTAKAEEINRKYDNHLVIEIDPTNCF